jgi:hypothetical protein
MAVFAFSSIAMQMVAVCHLIACELLGEGYIKLYEKVKVKVKVK